MSEIGGLDNRAEPIVNRPQKQKNLIALLPQLYSQFTSFGGKAERVKFDGGGAEDLTYIKAHRQRFFAFVNLVLYLLYGVCP
ncbi:MULTISPECIES: hypothetical protein [Paenibacillus]|uniref:Uncharacterized protein n=1 Tax=Paenibacillus borealis TaxID=160799 RepID=A0ABX3HDX9_PAEBO|nr:hypothetical protein [Paenibacillus borealis]OMD47344.1 hypothetical protein BSK56_14295 [Paenibacillus borealis]